MKGKYEKKRQNRQKKEQENKEIKRLVEEEYKNEQILNKQLTGQSIYQDEIDDFLTIQNEINQKQERMSVLKDEFASHKKNGEKTLEESTEKYVKSFNNTYNTFYGSNSYYDSISKNSIEQPVSKQKTQNYKQYSRESTEVNVIDSVYDRYINGDYDRKRAEEIKINQQRQQHANELLSSGGMYTLEDLDELEKQNSYNEYQSTLNEILDAQTNAAKEERQLALEYERETRQALDDAARKEEKEIRDLYDKEINLGEELSNKDGIKTFSRENTAIEEEKVIRNALNKDPIALDTIYNPGNIERFYEDGMSSDVYKKISQLSDEGFSDDIAKQMGKDFYSFDTIDGVDNGRQRIRSLWDNNADIRIRMEDAYFADPNKMFLADANDDILKHMYEIGNNKTWREGFINRQISSGAFQNKFDFAKKGTNFSELSDGQQDRIRKEVDIQLQKFNDVMETIEDVSASGPLKPPKTPEPKKKHWWSRKKTEVDPSLVQGPPEPPPTVKRRTFTPEGARLNNNNLNHYGGIKGYSNTLKELSDQLSKEAAESNGSVIEKQAIKMQANAVNAYKNQLEKSGYAAGRTTVMPDINDFLSKSGLNKKEIQGIEKRINNGLKKTMDTNTSGISKALKRKNLGIAGAVAAVGAAWVASEIWDE